MPPARLAIRQELCHGFPIVLALAFMGTPTRADGPDFNRDVRPILADKCYHCHGPDASNRKADLRLDTAMGAARVLKGKGADEAELVRRIVSKDPDEVMPPGESNFTKRLSPKEVSILKAWVASGGQYSTHWAFARPVSQPAPAVSEYARRPPELQAI
mgnify:FL=1